MPGMDGWETLHRLRAVLGNIPAGVMSGYNQSQGREQHGLGGPIETLTKPFSRQTLERSLNRMMSKTGPDA